MIKNIYVQFSNHGTLKYYSQNVMCICTKALSVTTTYYLSVLLPQSYFRKMGTTLMLVTMEDILYNTDVTTSVVKLITSGEVYPPCIYTRARCELL